MEKAPIFRELGCEDALGRQTRGPGDARPLAGERPQGPRRHEPHTPDRKGGLLEEPFGTGGIHKSFKAPRKFHHNFLFENKSVTFVSQK